MKISCNGCSETWTGHRPCHCAACHETFGSINGFDRHRVNYTCRPPAESGLIRNSRGHWGSATSFATFAVAA